MDEKDKFLYEYTKLCERHNLCLCPQKDWKRDYHDEMMIVEFDGDSQIFLEETSTEDER